MAACLALGGCSLINSTSDHTGGDAGPGGGVDAGRPDAGRPGEDAGPPRPGEDAGRPPGTDAGPGCAAAEMVPAEVVPAELCRVYAEVTCGGALTCCAPDLTPEQRAAARMDCVNQVLAGPMDDNECRALGMAALDANTGFTPGGASEYLRTGARLGACECDAVGFLQWSLDYRALFPGTRARTEPCDGAYGFLYCMEPASACKERTCGFPNELGESCSIFADDCTAELWCDPGAFGFLGRGTCQRRRGVGAECTTSNQCETLVCLRGSCHEATLMNLCDAFDEGG